MRKVIHILCVLLFAASAAIGAVETPLLTVSYDATREFFQAFNKEFAVQHPAARIRLSHGGSGKQARSVIDGLDADVVYLALAYDVDAIAQRGRLLPTNWQTRLPHNSAPFHSTVVFVVRKGNPKKIKDWDDLIRPGIKIVTPNPKTSGGARWNYLAAYGYELKRTGDPARARNFVGRLYGNVESLDSGARGSAVTFLQRGVGDVLIAWESEALLAQAEAKQRPVEVIFPSVSIRAEPVLAVVDKIARRRKTEAQARVYTDFFYSPKGQALGAEHFLRPSVPEFAEKYRARFSDMPLFTVPELFGSWADAHKQHFAEGGTFDRIYDARQVAK